LLPDGDNRTVATEEDRRKVFAALEVYCRQDTDAMVEIVRVLEDAAGAPAGGTTRIRGGKADVPATDRPEPEPGKGGGRKRRGKKADSTDPQPSLF